MSLSARMNKQVILQARQGRDAYGGLSTTWVNVIQGDKPEIFAAVEDLSGREFVAAGGTQNAVTTKITIRYRDGVVATMRAIHGNVVYSIEAVLGTDRRTLLLMCSKGANDG